MNRLLWKSLAALALLTGLAAPAAAETQYRVVDLGTLPGDYESMPWGINANGDVVGESTGPAGQRAFIFIDRAGMFELPAVARGSSSVARDINDLGQVVGQSNFHAVTWDLSTTQAVEIGPQSLDSLDRVSEALAVNNRGEIAGWYAGNTLSGSRHAFVYSNDRGMVDLIPRGPSVAHDLNDAGQAAGWHDGHAFLWEAGRVEFLKLIPGFKLATAYGINEFSEVVGSATAPSAARLITVPTSEHAFRFTPGLGMEDLGGEGELNMLRRINNHGQSIGQGRLADGKLQALIHSDAEGLRALNELITTPDQWYVDFATDINDEGVIAASARNAESRSRRAVKLVPVSDGPCLHKCIRITAIELQPAYTRDRSWVFASILVADENGNPLQGVEVTINGIEPDGTASTLKAQTGRDGRASFEFGQQRGAYVVEVLDLAKEGFEFDPDNSKALKMSVKV